MTVSSATPTTYTITVTSVDQHTRSRSVERRKAALVRCTCDRATNAVAVPQAVSELAVAGSWLASIDSRGCAHVRKPDAQHSPRGGPIRPAPRSCVPARLALCAAVLLVLVLAPAAAAAPKAPTSVGTDPASPSTATTPRIFGDAEEVIISGVGRAGNSPCTAAAGRAAAKNEPSRSTPNPAAPALRSPTAALGTRTLRHPVSVASESFTTFSANELRSHRRLGMLERHRLPAGQRPPQVPTLNAVAPASPADDNLPRVVGIADAEATVSIYGNSGCSAPRWLRPGETSKPAASRSRCPTTRRRPSTPRHPGRTSVGLLRHLGRLPGGDRRLPGFGRRRWDGGGEAVAVAPAGKSAAAAVCRRSGAGAPRLRTSPGRHANDNTPLVTGRAPGAARVQIYVDADCSRRACRLGPGLAVRGRLRRPGRRQHVDHSFYGVSIDAGGERSGCSAPGRLRRGLDRRRTRGSPWARRRRPASGRGLPLHRHHRDPPGTTFLCKLDRRRWRPARRRCELRASRAFKAHTPPGEGNRRRRQRRGRRGEAPLPGRPAG